MRFYKLDGTRAVECSIDEWYARGVGLETDRVALHNVGEVEVSTVFIGIDSYPSGPPQIFETMIFGEPFMNRCWRCSTWEQALEQHSAAVAMVRQTIEQATQQAALMIERAGK